MQGGWQWLQVLLPLIAAPVAKAESYPEVLCQSWIVWAWGGEATVSVAVPRDQ